MTIVQSGSFNPAAQLVPDADIIIVPPQVQYLNGVPANTAGIVGTASWGPVNKPTVVSDVASYVANFGPVMPRSYDLGTHVACAVAQGANNFRIVRVTDGTDTAATNTYTASSAPIAAAIAAAINSGLSIIRGPSKLIVAGASTTTVTWTSIYTGSGGNATQIVVGPGSAANTTKVTVSMPGGVVEVFDNITGATTTTTPATLGNGTAGTDGVTTITSTVLLGSDSVPRTGMYALRNTGCAVAWLADCYTSTSFQAQVTFGLAEGVYMVGTGAPGESMSSAITNKTTNGVDSYAFKLMLGDWVYWQDTYNGLQRLISPQPFVAGLIAAYGPQYSSLNQPLNSIVATQMSYSNQVYALADLQLLAQAGIDVITNPSVGGRYFSARFGHNSSSNVAIHGDNYTRMTNFIATTINSAAGQFVGILNTPGANGTQGQAQAFIESFFDTMLQAKPQPMIAAYSVQLDSSNNTSQSIAQGYLNAYVKVRYQSVVEFFNICMEGGQSVVTRQQTTPLV